MSMSKAAQSPYTATPAETARTRQPPAPARAGPGVLAIVGSWLRFGAKPTAPGKKFSRLRHEIELRAQLAVAEANAFAGQLHIVSRADIERRVQLAIAEADARAEQRVLALRHDIERRVQHPAAGVPARAVRSAGSEHHGHAATPHIDTQPAALLRDIEQRAQLAIAEARAYVDARIDEAVAGRHGPVLPPVWSPPMTWRIAMPPDHPEGPCRTGTEFARALVENGHDIAHAAADAADAASATAFVASHAPPSCAGTGPNFLVGYDWDEACYPLDWIDTLNAEFAGVGCASSHVQKILLDHGAQVPLAVVGLGIDDWERIAPDPDFAPPGKGFRFLHVSSCDSLSGVDSIIESFGRVFDDDDDVSLIVKPSGVVPGELRALLARLRAATPRFPDIVVVEDDLNAAELKALYARSHVFLAAGRATGFCMPLAHALLSGLPAVATAWGGHLDYCDETGAWLVDYRFQRARTSRDLVASAWAEPLPAALDGALWTAFRTDPAERFARAWSARKRLIDRFTWKDAALRLARLAHDESDGRTPRTAPARRAPRVGFVTTWNVKCGIAAYTAHLLSEVPASEYVIFAAQQDGLLRADERNCLRSWKPGIAGNGLASIVPQLSSCSIEALVLQFNHGFFDVREFHDLVNAAVAQGIAVLVELHSTADPPQDIIDVRLADYLDAFRKCHRLLAHGVADMNRLKALGLVDNVMLFPLGVLNAGAEPPSAAAPISPPLITSFGYCLPDKGLLELIYAVDLLKREGKRIRLRMLNAEYPHPVSAVEVRKLRDAIAHLGLQDDIEFRSEFLADDVCLALLGEADLVINPYQQTRESASAAVRFGLAARRPVVVTPLPIFDDLGDAVFRLPGTAPHQIAEGIAVTLAQLAENGATAASVRNAARRWREVHDIARQGRRLMRTARALARLQSAAA